MITTNFVIIDLLIKLNPQTRTHVCQFIIHGVEMTPKFECALWHAPQSCNTKFVKRNPRGRNYQLKDGVPFVWRISTSKPVLAYSTALPA